MTSLATIAKHNPDTIGPSGHTGRTLRARMGAPHPKQRLRLACSASAGPALGAIDPGGRETHGQPHQFTSLIDAKSASGLLGVPYTWLLAQAREGRIPHHRLGHYVRFNPEDLHDWLEETKLTPTSGHYPARRRGL